MTISLCGYEWALNSEEELEGENEMASQALLRHLTHIPFWTWAQSDFPSSWSEQCWVAVSSVLKNPILERRPQQPSKCCRWLIRTQQVNDVEVSGSSDSRFTRFPIFIIL